MNSEADRIKKAVGIDETGHCQCCNVSSCCDEISSALAEIYRLESMLENIRSVVGTSYGPRTKGSTTYRRILLGLHRILEQS